VSRAASLLLSLIFLRGAACAEMREWTDRSGKVFSAEIVATDAWRATFALPERRKAVLWLSQLSEADADFVAKWRAANPTAPLVDPQRLAPWPAEAAAADIEVKLKTEDPAATAFLYEGAHFTMQSDVRLPLDVVRDLNAVFEATRAALMALPLGLHRGGEREKYAVHFFSTPEQYAAAGGVPASGGYFDGNTGRMLLLLPNLGIRATGFARTYEHQKNLFVVKHEVTHQLLRRWGDALPVWFSEGFAEVIAAAPYARGRYTFSGMDAAIAAYVRKWRSPGDTKPLHLVPPARLMEFTLSSWEERVAEKSAYELYNSAALFVYFLLLHDGDGSAVAGFLDALRRERNKPRAEIMAGTIRFSSGSLESVSSTSAFVQKATADFIRRGRSDEKLAADFSAFVKKLGLSAEFEGLPPAR
jgi:hypothetical protein